MNNKQKSSSYEGESDRRKFTRISRNYVISYTPIKSGESKYDISQTKDLSEGGLLFVSNRKFEKDTVLKIKLRLPQFIDYIIVKAQVVGSDLIGESTTMHGTRARFIEIDDKVKEAIRKLGAYE